MGSRQRETLERWVAQERRSHHSRGLCAGVSQRAKGSPAEGLASLTNPLREKVEVLLDWVREMTRRAGRGEHAACAELNRGAGPWRVPGEGSAVAVSTLVAQVVTAAATLVARACPPQSTGEAANEVPSRSESRSPTSASRRDGRSDATPLRTVSSTLAASSRSDDEATRPAPPIASLAAHVGDGVALLTPNVLGVNHWSRLLGGLLYAASRRLDWPTLLRRSFGTDVLACPSCAGRLRVLGEVIEPATVRLVLESLGMPTEAPRAARARDPTELLGDTTDE